MATSDLELLDGWRSRRDAEAFREIVSRHASMVYRTARRLLGNPADAEDVAQDCFTRLATDDTLRIRSSLSGWLHHYAVGSSKEHLRREARRRGRESRAAAEAAAAGSAAPARDAILALVDEAIDQLPDDLRDVLVGHYLEGRSYEAIAERLGMSRRAAAYRAQKAIRRVRRRLLSWGVRVACAGLAAALSSESGHAAPPSLQATLGKVAVAGFRAERPPPSVAAAPATAGAALAGRAGFTVAKAAAAALALLALWIGGILYLHQDRAQAPPLAATHVAAETAAPPRPSTPVAAVAGAEPAGASAELPAIPELEAPAPAFAITGRVTDSASGEPVAGAVVELSFEKDFVDAGDDGRYSLEVGAGRHDLVAAAEGYARARASVAVTDPGDTLVDFALDRVVKVVVRATDAGGSPLPGVKVTPSEEEDGGSYDDRDSAVTDLRGEAVVLRNSRFGAKRPYFQARKEGYSLKEVSDVETGSDGSARVTIVLEDLALNTRAVTGRVTDSRGNPMAGARVTWNDGSVSYGPAGVVRKETADTNLDGRYRLEFRHRERRFSFLAHAAGFAPAWVQDITAGTPEAPATLDFVLDPGRTVEGEVAGEDGKPLPGAKVAVVESGGFWNFEDILSTVKHTATTDDRGRFAIAGVPEGFVSLEAGKSGWSSESFRGLPTGEFHRLTLHRPGVVRGRVVDLEGKAVPVFTVRVDTSSVNSKETGTAFTSTEGRFTIEHLHRRAGEALLTFLIEAEGYAPVYLRGVKPEAEEAAREHLVRLGKRTELVGKVIDAATGKPLPDARVCAGVPRFEEIGWIDWMLRTMLHFVEMRADDKGAFRFEEGEPLTLFVRAPGYRRKIVTPAMRPDYSDPGVPGSLEIALARGESITGTLAELSGGQRPRGAGLICLRETGTTGDPAVRDTYGFHELAAETTGTSFAWDDLHPARYLVFFDVPREAGTNTGERIYHKVELREGSRASVRIGEDLGNLSFEGRLLDANGRPRLQTSLVLRPLFAWDVELEGFSHDGKGSFTFRHLKPGRYRVEAARYQSGKLQVVELEPLVLEADTRRDVIVEW